MNYINFIRITILILIFTLTGCLANIYTYENTTASGDKCKLTIISGKDIVGAGLKITKDCSLEGSADKLTVKKEAYDNIKTIIDKVPF